MNNSLEKEIPLPVRYLLGLLPIGVIVVFYYLCIRYSINIPWFDDIENIPYFLVNWIEAPSLIEKWQTIIFPNNEHRVLAARLIVLGQYLVTNKLNFKNLAFCGNLSVLVLFGFITYSYLRQGGKWFLAVPIAFFIFNFQSYAGTFMTIMSLQYQMVILLSVASLYFLAKRRTWPFFLAIFLAYVDTFSMGNGMMVWPSGLVLLLFQARWRDAFIWTVSGAAAIYLYFHGYDFVQGNDKAFDYILQYPFRTFIAFFTMLGGDFDIIANAGFSKRMIIPTLAGLGLFAVFVIWLIGILSTSPFWGRWIPENLAKRYNHLPKLQNDNNRWNAFWLGTLVYVLISMILVVVFRTRFDPHIILWSTYKMYPAVMTSVIYILVIQAFTGRTKLLVFGSSLVVSIILWASTLINYMPIVEETAAARTAFAFNQKRNGIGLGATKNNPFETMLATTLLKVDKMRIYSLPKPLIHADEAKLTLKDSSVTASTKVTINELSPEVLSITQEKPATAGERNYAMMESKDNLYLFSFPLNNSGAIGPKGTIRAGEYEVGVWTVSKNGTKIFKTDQKVIIQ